MTRRLLQAVLLGAACLLFLSIATPAVAARSALSLEPAIGTPTAIVKAKGSGFAGREVVALYFDGLRIGSDVTNPNGKFNTQLTVPASARPGNHTGPCSPHVQDAPRVAVAESSTKAVAGGQRAAGVLA